MPSLSVWLIVQSDRQKQAQDRQKYISSHLIQSLSLNAKFVLADGTVTDRQKQTQIHISCHLIQSLIARFVLVDGTVTNRNRHRHIHISSHLIQLLSLNAKLVSMVNSAE